MVWVFFLFPKDINMEHIMVPITEQLCEDTVLNTLFCPSQNHVNDGFCPLGLPNLLLPRSLWLKWHIGVMLASQPASSA